ncbi:DNA repair protein XRCC4 isoform X2 [Syngnathoides biaculeatus]|nr:DNA repair protein XRCC4 isoform X2 [Syngnathoides biaculeatus]XP_061657494.1 DNA repair protein XRCC4 isoform X2 [Syngnathoides biaculeatus]XP_061657495.1 DNA repair protein XRCC4 isoform X2 [Syngnathoides biaculeatus]
MDASVREILVSSRPGSSYFLRAEASGRGFASGFRVLLSDGRRAWRGEASEASVRREADELEMSEEKYVRDLREALTGGGSADSYRFDLSPPPPPDDGAAITLTYAKVRKDISFRLGSVALSPVPEPSEAARGLLTLSLARGTSLEHRNRELREQNRRLGQEHRRVAAELRRYVEGKEELEAELYSRFVLVLNEKKAKIRRLQESLNGLQAGHEGPAKETRQDGDRAAKAGEDLEYGGTTDDDDAACDEIGEGANPKQFRHAAAAVCPPFGETRTRSPGPLDDGPGGDITDVAPTRERRLRHPEASHARSDFPAATDQQRPPRRRRDAAEAEDLFEDF